MTLAEHQHTQGPVPGDVDTDATRPPNARERHELEYRKLLDERTEDELHAIAKVRGFPLAETEREAVIAELATQLSDPQSIRAQLLAIDDVGKGLLAYLHLIVTPGRGLSAEGILRELSRRRGSGEMGEFKHSGQEISNSAVVQQLVALGRRGLVLSFRQRHQLYHSVPMAVRACLPSMTDLFPPYPHQRAHALHVQETSPRTLVRTLYEVWNAITTLSLPGSQRRRETRASGPFDRLQRDPTSSLHIADQWSIPRDPARSPEEDASHERHRPYLHVREPIVGRFGQTITVPTPGYRLGDADRAILRRGTGCSDREIEFYYVLLEALGAIAADPGEPIATHRDVLAHLLTFPLDAQLRTVFQAWEMNTTWSELEFVLRSTDDDSQLRLRRNPMRTRFKPPDLYEEWRSGRQTVLRFLSLIEPNQWISLHGFLETVFEIDPDLLHTRTDRAVWWFESTRTRRQFGTTYDDWQASYGRYVVATIAGPLAWLGAVSLGYVDGELAAFRLTPAGAFALGRRQAPPGMSLSDEREGQSQPAYAFGKDMTLSLVPYRASRELHDLLHTVGELQRMTPEQFVYRITPEGVHEWVESYVHHTDEKPEVALEILIATLDSLGQPIPDAWRKQLDQWRQNYGQLHVYEGLTVIELADDYALRELLASTSLREHLVYQFSPRLVAIQANAVDTLVEEMEKRGYTPRLE
jgi:hypothetical protein